MRIGVIEVDQSKVSRHISKSGADSLVRRLLAERISKSLIKMLPVESVDPLTQYLPELPYQFDGIVPDTLDRLDWSEPICATYPARNQSSYESQA